MNQRNFYVLNDQELLLETTEMDITAGFVSPDVLRLIARKKGAKQEETFVLNQKPEWIKIQARIDGEKVILSTSLVQVLMDLQTLQFKAYNQKGTLLTSSKEVPWTNTPEGITLSLELDPREGIYGLGQDPMANLDQKGHERRMWNATDRKRKSGNNGIPFYTSSKPYGFLLNSSYPSRFAVGKATVAQPPEPRIDEKGQEKNPFPWPWDQPNPFSSPDDLSVLLDSDRFECFFIFKDSLDEIQEVYAWLTGTPPMPPRWAFGFIQSKNRYRSMEELIAIADKYRKKDVPLSCLVIDWLWFKEFGDYEWDKAHWPDPEKGIQYLNDLGIQVMQAQHPYIDRESLQYEPLLQKGFLNHVPAHARPTFDFSNPQAQAYYWDSLVKKLYQIGIRGFWTDMGEPEDHPLGTNCHIGSRERLHNIYASLWSQAIYEGQRRDFDERVYILSRAAYAGIQRNGVTLWSNDISASWEVLKDQVVVGQTVALSGQPYWCTDIGGFVTGREFSPELMIRWYQWGVFCPIFRTHGTRADNEVWSFGPEAEKIISSYIKLRTRLLPYIYSCAHMITKQAKPMMRGMCMDFPHDKIAVSQQSQYMFGPCFLVAPVTEPGCRSRKVYLPQGLWYDFWTNETYEGEQWLDAFAPLEQIPLFVKAGSIIPMAKSLFQTGDMRLDQPYLHVYPGQEGQFDFYEDDGKTYGYEKGEYDLTEITMDKTGNVSMRTKHETGIYPKRDRQFYIVYPEKASTKIEYFVDADLKDHGDCHVYSTVMNRTDQTIHVIVEFAPVPGWKGDKTQKKDIKAGESVVFHCLLKPDSELLPVCFLGKVFFTTWVDEHYETLAKDFTFGSGFASRFQLIGDFEYDIKAGIQTVTPVEKSPDLPVYYFKGKEYMWYRREDYEFNCMGYVYCWKQKIENGLGTVSYGKCRVYSEERQKVKIECSADQGVKIFLNDQEVYYKDGFLVQQVLPIEVVLQKGLNSLLIKVAQNHPKPFSGRELGFSFRFVDQKEQVIDDILYGP